jgi:hypothetical protein
VPSEWTGEKCAKTKSSRPDARQPEPESRGCRPYSDPSEADAEIVRIEDEIFEELFASITYSLKLPDKYEIESANNSNAFEEQQTCTICEKFPRNTMFRKCNHSRLCVVCALDKKLLRTMFKKSQAPSSASHQSYEIQCFECFRPISKIIEIK